MCGITGIYSSHLLPSSYEDQVKNATMQLHQRGPDFQATQHLGKAVLGHARLSIIDTSSAGNQPMADENNRYSIVFNGEIYNFKSLKQDLIQKGYTFHSGSDTEVLLKCYMAYGPDCLEKLNGFFAFAIYDKLNQQLFIARDRIGIKPLLYYHNQDFFAFASEMKALMKFSIPKTINFNAVYTFFQLNYIPGPDAIIAHVKKLLPGHYLLIKGKEILIKKYYTLVSSFESPSSPPDYLTAQKRLDFLLRQSVERRLIADVPLGSFLSGGIDSSVIAYLASQQSPNIHTFSIGFKDEPFFDETFYAQKVAEKLKTHHTVFSLSNDDLLAEVDAILDYVDEPFADSSAIAVYILCKKTKQKITVALSGDGADEMLGGYNKHDAEWRARQKNALNLLVKMGSPIWKKLPNSRNSKIGNLFRQLNRFAQGLNLTPQERYWHWCSFVSEKNVMRYFKPDVQQQIHLQNFQQTQQQFTQFITGHFDNLNDLLYADMHLVLPNDMLQKVDLMSMANSLEVRVPFLDHEVVDYCFSLPSSFKIDKAGRKKILKNLYRSVLPQEIFTRPKHGFEVPLLKWFRQELRYKIENDWLSKPLIEAQGVFDYTAIHKIKNQLYSSNPEDSPAQIWAFIVFQNWWKKNIGDA